MTAKVTGSSASATLGIALAMALGPAVAQGFGRFAYALLVPAMRVDLHWSLTQAGVIASANAAGYLIGAIIANRIATRIGLHRTFGLGLAGTTLAILATAFVSAFGAVFAIRLLTGIFGAFAYVTGGGITARLPYRPGSTPPLVVYFAGGGMGIVLSGIGVPWVVASADDDWRAGWIALAAIAFVAAMIAANVSRQVPESTAGIVHRERPAVSLRAIHISYALFGAGYVAYMTFVIALLHDRGQSSGFQSLFWVVLGLAAIAASFLWRYLPEHIKGRRELALTNALTAIGVLIVLSSDGAIWELASAMVFGGAFLAVVGAVTGLGRALTPPATWTRVIGTLTGAFALGQCTGPIVAGMLSDRPHGIEAGLLLSVTLLVAAAGVALLQPEPAPFELTTR